MDSDPSSWERTFTLLKSFLNEQSEKESEECETTAVQFALSGSPKLSSWQVPNWGSQGLDEAGLTMISNDYWNIL